jgi:hypothetical protein
VQGTGPGRGQLGFQPVPHRWVGAGELQVVQGGPQVKAGSPGQHRNPATGADIGDRLPGEPLVGGDARRPPDIPDVEQVVRHAAPLRGAELGGAYVHAGIQLHRVGIDHLAAQGLCQPQR